MKTFILSVVFAISLTAPLRTFAYVGTPKEGQMPDGQQTCPMPASQTQKDLQSQGKSKAEGQKPKDDKPAEPAQ